MYNWRNEPITSKQKKLIDEMNEFSVYPLEPFSGKTKGEASDWITRNLKKSYETFDFNGHGDNFGDRV